jgi:hypothetical protein
MPCRPMFKYCNIFNNFFFTHTRSDIFIKCYEDFMGKDSDIHNHNTWMKLKLQAQHYNTDSIKKSMINMGTILYNEAPDQDNFRENFL